MSQKKTKSKDASRTVNMNVPQQDVARFFQHIEERAWTDAEKDLDVIIQKSDSGQWARGYVKGLEGLLLSFRNSDDKYILLPRILSSNSPETLSSLKQEFGGFSINELHGVYDRGFFKALEDYLSTLATLERPRDPTLASERSTVEEASLPRLEARQEADEE